MQPVAKTEFSLVSTSTVSAAPTLVNEEETPLTIVDSADLSKETEEKQLHGDRIRQSQIEAQVTEAINAANKTLCKAITDKLMTHVIYMKLFATKPNLGSLAAMQTKEEMAMLEHSSTLIATLFEQPAFTEMITPVQQELGFTTMKAMARAYLAPFIKEHVAKIKEISPEHITALCKVYDDSQAKLVIQKVAHCLALIMTQKPSADECKVLLEIVDAKDKKACLQEKNLPSALFKALDELFSMPACSDDALSSIKNELKKQLTS
jgi:hypothetical protein